jgi:LysR family transcriptional regulator, nitrogen assimilation regulatory protein
MDFDDLNAFIHVAKQGGFSKAAAELRVAQSALSRRVARLEHHLGVPLFKRNGRGVAVTKEGSALLDRAEGLIRELNLIEKNVLMLAKEPAGRVTVALPPTTGQVIGPLLAAACRERFPRITLELREGISGFIHEWLATEQVDLALLYDPERAPGVEVFPLIDEPLYLIAPALSDAACEIAGIETFPLARLGLLPLIVPSHSHSLRRLLERLGEEHRFALRIANQVDGMRITKGMVAAGLGYTVFSYAGVYEEVEAGTLRAIPLKPTPHWRLSLVHRTMPRGSPAQFEIKRLIEQQVQSLVDRKLWRGAVIGPSTAKVLATDPDRNPR